MDIIIGFLGIVLSFGMFVVVSKFQSPNPLQKGNVIVYIYLFFTLVSGFFLREYTSFIIFISGYTIFRSVLIHRRGKIKSLTLVITVILLLLNIIIPFIY